MSSKDQPEYSSARQTTQSRRKITAVVAVLGLAAVSFLAFGVFGVHTLFVDDTVDEAGPVFAASADAVDDEAARGDEVDGEAVENDDKPDGAMEDDAMDEDSSDDAMDDEESNGEATDAASETAVGEVVVLSEGSFIAKDHPTSGVSRILNDGSAQRFLRFEDFETDNGPDLFVYLTSADAADDDDAFGQEGEFVNLGQLKGNIGDQNYEIPVDVDLDKFDTVVIWCRRFGVPFGAADLT